MEIRFSHHRPRVERARPDVAIGWTIRVTISEGDTQLFDDLTVGCPAMPIDPAPRRVEVDALISRLLHDPNGHPRPPLQNLIDLFYQRRRFADVHNFKLAED